VKLAHYVRLRNRSEFVEERVAKNICVQSTVGSSSLRAFDSNDCKFLTEILSLFLRINSTGIGTMDLRFQKNWLGI
jgi:hypothetical protein